jgi:uncharacterized protein (DUF427 family)
MKATWNGAVLADSGDTVVVEGNHYFPAEAINREFLRPSDLQTTCSWKGVARYYSIEVGGRQNPDAAWYYADPLPAAEAIAGRVAFWKGVRIEG